jgi:hypothetical protein
MSEEQLKILKEVADNIQKTPITEQSAHRTLVDAGIITEKGNVKKPYRTIVVRKSE